MALTLAKLIDANILRQWQPGDGRMVWRGFYYSELWRVRRDGVPRLSDNRAVRWWNDPSVPSPEEDDAAFADVPEIDLVTLDLSMRGRLDGFIETFVVGWPRPMLVRKRGFGMEPPFQRMRPPREAVVEMRTEHTRTFGFFVRPGVFVAHRLALADDTHADTRLYGILGDEVLTLLRRVADTDKDETSDVETLIGDGLPNDGP